MTALRAEGGPIASAVAASQEIEQAAQAVTEAEHELDLFIGNPKLLSLLGEQKFLEGVEVRQRELDEARTRVAELSSQSALASELADGDLLETWPTLDLSRGAVSCMDCSTGSCSVAATAVGKAARRSPSARRSSSAATFCSSRTGAIRRASRVALRAIGSRNAKSRARRQSVVQVQL